MTLESPTIDRSELEGKLLPELQRIAQSLGVAGAQRLRKGDLIAAIVAKSASGGTNGDEPAPAVVAETSADALDEGASGNGRPEGAVAVGSEGSADDVVAAEPAGAEQGAEPAEPTAEQRAGDGDGGSKSDDGIGLARLSM